MSGYFIKSKYKLISSLIRRKFQRFRNFSFENISLCFGKHIGRSLTEFATLYSFKLAVLRSNPDAGRAPVVPGRAPEGSR